MVRYTLLEIDQDRPTCIYCGGLPTEWDHLMPLVERSAWTGYFTEIANLVPACGKCNQSRGSKPFAQWMRSSANQSPFRTLQLRDNMSQLEVVEEVERRIAIIENAARVQPPTRIPLLDDPLEVELEVCRKKLNELLYQAEAIAAQLRQRYAAFRDIDAHQKTASAD